MSAVRRRKNTRVPPAHDTAAVRVCLNPRERLYRRGVEILAQGDRAEAAYLIDCGLAKLLRRNADGTESIVALRGRGQFLGADSALLDREQVATATAVTECRVQCFGAAAFRELVRTDTVLSWRLHLMLSHELEESFIVLSEIRSLSARVRLSKLLDRLGTWIQGTDRHLMQPVELPLKQWEIAQLVGVTPQYVCQMLSELEREGLIQRARSRVLWTSAVEGQPSCTGLQRESEIRAARTPRPP